MWRLGLGLLLSLPSHLSYEAFYFQEFALLAIAATLRGHKMEDLPWRVLTGIILINIGCIAFNRLMPGGIHKNFTRGFLLVFDAGFSHFLAILGHAVREHRILAGLSVVGATLSGATCLARMIGARRLQIALFVVISAILVSGFLYAFAGYPLHAEGPMARTFMVIATLYAVAAGVLSASAWCTFGKSRALATTFWVCTVIGLIALCATARFRVGEWADTWAYEVAKLPRLPVVTTDAGQAQRVYVVIEGELPTPIEPATAPSEITGAAGWAFYQKTGSRLRPLDLWRGSRTAPRWFVASADWFNR